MAYRVIGSRVRWARQQLGLTMRTLRQEAGVAIAFQSEIENERKSQVGPEKLASWLRRLQITEPFVRGEINRYRENATACKGLCADVGERVLGDLAHWASMDATDRCRNLLKEVARNSQRLTPLVAAWVLHLELDTLNDMIHGRVLMSNWITQALADMTGLPGEFVRKGEVTAEMNALQAYSGAIRKAIRMGLSPQALERLLDQIQGDPLAAANDQPSLPDLPSGL